MNELAQALVDALSAHTPFAQAIVRRQAERAGLDPAQLRREDLPRLVPMLLSAARVFVEPAALAALEKKMLTA